jgi:hypothetical protein
MEAATTAGARQGYRMRCLRDIWVEVAVDLDREGPVEVVTDFDALSASIARIAAAGGFALRLACEGGPCADAGRVVEDCALELGAALREALGPAASAVRFRGAPGSDAAFFESFGRALGARFEIEGHGKDTRPPSADCFADVGKAIRAAARSRAAVSRR